MSGIGQVYAGDSPAELSKDEVGEVSSVLASRLEELDKFADRLSKRLHRVLIRDQVENGNTEQPVQTAPQRSPLCADLWERAIHLEHINVRLRRLLSDLVLH